MSDNGQHGIEIDGFLAVFCERENLLATYPHVCEDLAAWLKRQGCRSQACGAPASRVIRVYEMDHPVCDRSVCIEHAMRLHAELVAFLGEPQAHLVITWDRQALGKDHPDPLPPPIVIEVPPGTISG